MKTMTVTEFKAHALKAISDVATSYESLILTKRGKPIVEVVPIQDNPDVAEPGRLAHMFVSEQDIVSPLGAEIWDAAQ